MKQEFLNFWAGFKEYAQKAVDIAEARTGQSCQFRGIDECGDVICTFWDDCSHAVETVVPLDLLFASDWKEKVEAELERKTYERLKAKFEREGSEA